MKERPILFSTEMVRAILDGRKTQTRRVKSLEEINLNPVNWRYVAKLGGSWEDKANYVYRFLNNVFHPLNIVCPYGEPGDRLWVRETWQKRLVESGGFGYTYKANDHPFDKATKWKPSIFMPREACRILLEVTDVRVERLQDISEEDAMAEGISLPNYAEQAIKDVQYPEPSAIYAELWESINGKGSWEKNPWVWVVSFRRIES